MIGKTILYRNFSRELCLENFNFSRYFMLNGCYFLANIYLSKSTIETLEKGVKYVHTVNYKNTKTTSTWEIEKHNKLDQHKQRNQNDISNVLVMSLMLFYCFQYHLHINVRGCFKLFTADYKKILVSDILTFWPTATIR